MRFPGNLTKMYGTIGRKETSKVFIIKKAP